MFPPGAAWACRDRPCELAIAGSGRFTVVVLSRKVPCHNRVRDCEQVRAGQSLPGRDGGFCRAQGIPLGCYSLYSSVLGSQCRQGLEFPGDRARADHRAGGRPASMGPMATRTRRNVGKPYGGGHSPHLAVAALTLTSVSRSRGGGHVLAEANRHRAVGRGRERSPAARSRRDVSARRRGQSHATQRFQGWPRGVRSTCTR